MVLFQLVHHLSKQPTGEQPHVSAEPQELGKELVADLAVGVPLLALTDGEQKSRRREGTAVLYRF